MLVSDSGQSIDRSQINPMALQLDLVHKAIIKHKNGKETQVLEDKHYQTQRDKTRLFDISNQSHVFCNDKNIKNVKNRNKCNNSNNNNNNNKNTWNGDYCNQNCNHFQSISNSAENNNDNRDVSNKINNRNNSNNNSLTSWNNFIFIVSLLIHNIFYNNTRNTYTNNHKHPKYRKYTRTTNDRNNSDNNESFLSTLILLIMFSSQIVTVYSAADASKTNITDPSSGFPLNSTILSTTNSTVTITARDSTGTTATTSEIFFGELYSSDSCEVGYASSSCEVLCYPYNSPHTTAPQCESYSTRYSYDSDDSALWVVTDVTSLGSGQYRIDYDDKVEVADSYDLSIYLLTNGGLRGRYWDNIWMVDNAVKTQIDSEINFNWGTSAITTYGTDYVSIRWEGKIKPPYNETYTFYIYADDGARIWIDKILIADSWDKCCNETWGSVDLKSIAYHDIIVEYREIRGEGFMELRWASPSIAKTIVPSTYLYYQDDIQDSPYSGIDIDVGTITASETTVNDESPFATNTAGVNNSVFVTARDAFGQVVSTDTANFTLTNLDGMTSTATWRGSGVYKITFQANSKTDNTSFSIRLGTPPTHISGSPFWVVVDPATTAPANATLYGPGLRGAVAGQQASFNLTVFDEYGNEREQGTDTITVRFTGADAGKGTCSYSDDGGLYNCEYTLTTRGIYTPIVEINGESAGTGSLANVNVTSGTIHAPSCTIQNESITAIAGIKEAFFIQARDQFGNKITSTHHTFVALVNGGDDNSSVATTVTAIGVGKYNVSYTPSTKGDYEIAIKLSGVHVDNSPFTVTVSPGAVDASISYVIGSSQSNGTGHYEATSNVETYFWVQTVDSENNTLESDMGGFSTSTLVCGATTITVNCSYQSDGMYECVYTPTTSSDLCSLTLEISGTDIENSPFTVDVSPGTIDADTTYAYGMSNGVAGTANTFTIQARDTNFNDLESGGHTFYVYLVDRQGSESDITGTVTDNLDGTYSVSYTTTVANSYESLKVELFQVGGLLGNYYTDYEFTNLFTSLGQNKVDTSINFDWGTDIPLDPTFEVSDYFSINWDGHLYPPYSETYTIYTPIYGNSGVRLYIDDTLVIDSWDPSLGDTDPYALIQLTANTYYSLNLQFREQTGNAKVSLEWNSPSIDTREVIPSTYLYYTKTINGTSYIGNVSIIPDSTDASSCTVTGDGLSSTIAGEEATLTVTAKDSYGNVQTDAGNEEASFNITLTTTDGRDLITVGTVVDAGNAGSDGLYTATYNVTNATTDYTLVLSYDEATFYTSTVTVDPNSISGIAQASTAVISSGRAGEEQSFLLYLRDAFGNLCECGGSDNPIDLNVNFTHSDGITTVAASSMVESEGGSGNGAGIFTVYFTATKNGAYTPYIVAENVILSGVTSTFNITDAIASATYTFVHGWESGAGTTINSGQATTQVIQVQDIYQNNLTVNGGYNFYITMTNAANTSTVFGNVTSLTNGRYELQYVAATAGTYTLSVQLASGDVNEPDGLTGAYYNNRWLYGDPLLTQVDTNISHAWADGLVTTTAKDYVSVRWTGFIKPAYAEVYNFTIISDDGSRLRINNILIFDEFLSNAGTFYGYYTFDVANLLYPITIDWRENTADADIALYWNSTSQAHGLVTQSSLFSSATDIKSSPFTVTAT